MFCFIVTPVDTTPPVVTNGPTTIQRTVELGETSLMVTWADPATTDFSETQQLISRSHAPGAQFPLGNTLVTYVFGDASGNTVTYTFCVSVQTGKSHCYDVFIDLSDCLSGPDIKK